MYNLQAIIRKGINNSNIQFERLGNVGQNFANFGTTGYKNVRFEQFLTEDGYVTGTKRTDCSQGALKITNNPYDVAIKGTGYIPVVSEDGQVAYTRDGSFKIGKDGYLVTSDDWLVGSGIQIPSNIHDFQIKRNGDVMVQDSAQSLPRKIGNIPLVQFSSPEGLAEKGHNKLVQTDESGEPKLIKNHDFIYQNNIETANVDIYGEVNTMLRLNASMLAHMQLMKVAYDMYNKGINIRES